MAKKAKAKKAKATAKAATKRKNRTKTASKGMSELLNFKCHKYEKDAMKAKAKKHAASNLSAWVRCAVVCFEPNAQQKKEMAESIW